MLVVRVVFLAHALVHGAQRVRRLACVAAMGAEGLRGGPFHARFEGPRRRCTVVGGGRGLGAVGNGRAAMHFRLSGALERYIWAVGGQGSR